MIYDLIINENELSRNCFKFYFMLGCEYKAFLAEPWLLLGLRVGHYYSVLQIFYLLKVLLELTVIESAKSLVPSPYY